ncbi:SAM-dependent DNA methyltransferase [Subsaximicrobium wynnwilliamsii]|uniref:site-specific DNA-methyltransferase (adenine-specific) n=1 Tax=Subsaximicrobium wynnwilliamsii TaxID=291179 RepID=A0A5C6ZAZ5_9FLAO|nr:class I SAM-dependent DNA methyltransferase [Subsaximicrobium wynnwilliamsii]TXD81493.1 SAM-dependent DNA methyltransferase [Subsaximicrobium wynnwilliamsii]TXD87160.1 SAM-dependent DNA methyltransferase [Subsaximicrobium wynnwilliamsii]TXE00853.1 SAM-dependent DNA methyltransferase [Subsaximicrobium wynnwilliamsii]
MIDFKEKANLIWEVADLLRGDYKQSDYGKVILPLTVLRRLDCVLQPTKDEVLAHLPKVEDKPDKTKDLILNKIAGHNFHNRSQYDFKKLVAEPDKVAANLRNYINGFSSSSREIIEYFNFDDQIERMDDPKADILFQIVKKFSEIDLSVMDSMDMGYTFEELIRRFAEQSNETAGEHFTPREVIKLMVNLLFISDNETLTKEGIVKTLYDPACGTGGMLSIGEQHLKSFNKKAKLEVFGQEINPESYAICKSDMLIKGQNPSNIKFGNTFTVDGLEDEKFDYMLSNPPFGVDWKKAQKTIKLEHENKGYSGRFGAGLPRINDGSFLFLQHMISKMKPDGTRIAVVFNGSPLFSGSAGSGESNIRQWIIENDWLEAIIAMPDQLFYNTGISTYVWIVNNKKEKQRKGKIQLINATGTKDDELIAEGKIDFNRFYEKMTKSLGNKRKKIIENGEEKGIGFITELYGDFEENGFSKIYPNDFFGYWRATIEQPDWSDLMIKVAHDKQALVEFLNNASSEDIERKVNDFETLSKMHIDEGKWILKENELTIEKGKKIKVKPNSSSRDYENIPFLKLDANKKLVSQTIKDYFKREVKPHLPEAWVDESKTKIGYEINFTKYFYEFKPLRSLEDIKAEIFALETTALELEKKVLY